MWYSTGDGVVGFNQIRNTPFAKVALAIVSVSCKHLPGSLVFGPRNGPDDFLRFGCRVFRSKLFRSLFLFVDDIAIATGHYVEGEPPEGAGANTQPPATASRREVIRVTMERGRPWNAGEAGGLLPDPRNEGPQWVTAWCQGHGHRLMVSPTSCPTIQLLTERIARTGPLPGRFRLYLSRPGTQDGDWALSPNDATARVLWTADLVELRVVTDASTASGSGGPPDPLLRVSAGMEGIEVRFVRAARPGGTVGELTHRIAERLIPIEPHEALPEGTYLRLTVGGRLDLDDLAAAVLRDGDHVELCVPKARDRAYPIPRDSRASRSASAGCTRGTACRARAALLKPRAP